MYEFSCLRSKAYYFKCSDEKTNKLNIFSRSKAKNFNFDECYKCLICRLHQKVCDIFVICSKNQEMCLRKVTKNSLPAFDEKHRYTNETESTPWN